MSKFSYAAGTTPDQYVCTRCKTGGVKLWREYQTFADQTELLCASCACKNQHKEDNVDEQGFRSIEFHPGHKQRTDQIGWFVPAVPCEEDPTNYWGYTSVPQDGVNWWKNIPTRKAN